MAEEQTWRDLLGSIISDTHERQRIAAALGINPVTLSRWSTGKSKPRQDNLRPLLDALPTYREQFTSLIAKDFPGIAYQFPVVPVESSEIPSAFYAQVFQTYTATSPQLRTSTIGLLILQHMVNHLGPQKHGLVALIAQCVPPAKSAKVHSLRMTMGQATPPWNGYVDRYVVHFGAESQVGHALISRHPIIMQCHGDKARQFPTHQSPEVESSMACPILIADLAAGSLFIGSTQQNFFSQARLDLIQNYAELLVLAFETHQFYPLDSLDLAAMPSPAEQEPLLASFQPRVTRLLIQAAQNKSPLTRPQAELIAWHELEEALLHLPLKHSPMKELSTT